MAIALRYFEQIFLLTFDGFLSVWIYLDMVLKLLNGSWQHVLYILIYSLAGLGITGVFITIKEISKISQKVSPALMRAILSLDHMYTQLFTYSTPQVKRNYYIVECFDARYPHTDPIHVQNVDDLILRI